MPLKISFEVAAVVQAFHFFTLRAKIKNSETTLSSRSCLRWRWSLADLRGTRSGLEKSSSSRTFSNQLDNKKWKHTKRENDTKYLFAILWKYKNILSFFHLGTNDDECFLRRKKKTQTGSSCTFQIRKKTEEYFCFLKLRTNELGCWLHFLLITNLSCWCWWLRRLGLWRSLEIHTFVALKKFSDQGCYQTKKNNEADSSKGGTLF